MPQAACLVALRGAVTVLVCGAVPRWNAGLALAAMVVSLLLGPVAASDAEAARAFGLRASGPPMHQRTAITAGPRMPAFRARSASSRQTVAKRRIRPAPSAPILTRAARISAAEPAVASALLRAQHATGADPALLSAIAGKESSFDPKARNRLSSARGLMQFTRSTWLQVVRDFGPKHGLGRYAAALNTNRDGIITARDGRTLTQILKLRDDPHLAAIMAAERMGQERASLERDLGRAARPQDMYLVHLLGPSGARRFLAELKRNPAQPSTAVVGAAARPNPGVFARRGRNLPLAQVYEEVADMLERETDRPSLQLTSHTASPAVRLATFPTTEGF